MNVELSLRELMILYKVLDAHCTLNKEEEIIAKGLQEKFKKAMHVLSKEELITVTTEQLYQLLNGNLTLELVDLLKKRYIKNPEVV